MDRDVASMRVQKPGVNVARAPSRFEINSLRKVVNVRLATDVTRCEEALL